MQQERRSHIIIAGTGRTGTTFLVQYLTELGLDTHISRHGSSQLDANANAGLEDMPLVVAPEHLPYVIKAPWIGEYIDEVLASSEIRIDAAILPVRNLVEAAASRTILELRAMHQSAPHLAQLTETWENWALTPGGTIFSLNPLDQARILAIGFHRLVQRLVDAEIPILLLGFPRLIEDGDYLFERLKSLLPETVTPEQARVAHQRTAQRKKVRVGDELGSEQHRTFSAIPVGINYPDRDRLDRIALGREIARLNQEIARLNQELARLNQERAHDQTTIADLGRRAADAQMLTAQFEAQCLQTIEAGRQAGALAAELEAQRLRTAEAGRQAEALAIEIEALRRSWSWRATAWLRWLSTTPRAS
jgi:hypothetical protein